MQTVERAILIALLRDMRAAGYQPAAVWDGGDYVMATDEGVKSFGNAGLSRIMRPLTNGEVLDAVDSVWESTLHFTYRNSDSWGTRGVLIILGNGDDVISDHHSVDDEPFNSIISALGDRINNGEPL